MFRKLIVGFIFIIFIFFVIGQISKKDNKYKNYKEPVKKVQTIPKKTPEQLNAQIEEKKKEEKESYINQVKREIKSLDEWDSKEHSKLDTVLGVVMQTALISAYAMIVNNSSKHKLSVNELNLAKTLRKKAISRQLKEFPRIRDKYGPVVRKKLWDLNMSARTIGNKYTIIEYVGAVFANNINIKEFQGMVRETLTNLRFKQSRYKWYKEDDEYTYYTINSPSDSQFGFWENQRFIEVDVKPQTHTQRKPQEQHNYQVNVQEYEGILLCNVTFSKVPASSIDAEAIVRGAMKKLVKKDPSFEILGMAFNQEDRALDDIKYGGPLVYKPADGKIMSMDERDGKKIVEADQGTYFIKSKDMRTAKGITPVRRWINLSIVFPSKPSNVEIKNVSKREIEKIKQRRLDINIRIHVGDKDNPGSWDHIQASNGYYMNVDYKVNTDKIKANWNWDK